MYIDSGGMMIGSGESTETFMPIANNGTQFTHQTEQMYVISDNDVRIVTGLQIPENRRQFDFTSSGNLVTPNNVTVRRQLTSGTVDDRLQLNSNADVQLLLRDLNTADNRNGNLFRIGQTNIIPGGF